MKANGSISYLIGDCLVSKLVILVEDVRAGNGGDCGAGKEG